jgi:serine/threonine protein kinase
LSAFRLDRELGRGGMAVVYAGRQEALDRPVAVKMLAAELAGDPDFRRRFLREARIAARLQHPNLVRVFDVTEIDGRPCIVMELVEGRTLDGARVTLDEAAQIADGLAYAHDRGVVHRDLKPANLLRRADGIVKIADFGIARAVDETQLTQTGTVLGTLRYLAPEQAEGREVGQPADVYALAVVLEELLPEQPLPVRDALARARSVEPEARPTARELAGVLRRSEPVAATTAVLPRRHASRRLRPAALAVALAALVAGVTVAAATRHDGSSTRVEPVPQSDAPAQQARNLAAWLRHYSEPAG